MDQKLPLPYGIKMVAMPALAKKKKKLRDEGYTKPQQHILNIDGLNTFDDKKEYITWKQLSADDKKKKIKEFLGRDDDVLYEQVDLGKLKGVKYDKINGRIKKIEVKGERKKSVFKKINL